MNQNKLDELNRLARGTVKEKKIALTYGYQPIIDKLKRTEIQTLLTLPAQ